MISYRAAYRAKNMDDAVAIATRRWRDVTGDETAALPWSATISIDDDWDDEKLKEGKRVELNISTTIEDAS